MNRGLMVTLLALTLALTGCAGAIRNDAGGNGAPPPSTPGQGPGSGVGAPGNDFSLRVGAGVLALRDWDSEVDLRALLGPPRREEVRTLGPGSDTYQGSFVKELSFPGLDLTLFSPPDNGRSFWIMEMRVSGEQFSTPRGVRVGDPLAALQEAYPELEPVPDGRQDPCNRDYRLPADAADHLIFEVRGGRVDTIHLYHEFP